MDLNITRYCLEQWAFDDSTANEPAFTFARKSKNNDTWTYREIWDLVQSIGQGYLSLGLKKGDRVLIRLPHSPEYAFAFFGANIAGLIPIPASPQLTNDEASFLLEDSGASCIVQSSNEQSANFNGITIEGHNLFDMNGNEELPLTKSEDPGFLIYTSGTTAKPKGVLHAQRTVLGRALMQKGWQDFQKQDITMHAGTLNWSYTLGVGLLDAWAVGAHATLQETPTQPSEWPEIIETLRINVFSAVPTIFRQILKYSEIEKYDLSSLRHVLCGGEPLTPALYEEWESRTNTIIHEALGMTELSTYISSSPTIKTRIGSPGKPQPGRNVVILPEDSDSTEPLPPNETGLLASHRSDPGLMLGYWNRPEEESTVFRGDWFIGGDRAAMDDDGYIWFQGRADDVIKSFGFRLSPVEIEAILESHPAVSEAAVVGYQIDESKTLVTACIVPIENHVINDEHMQTFATEHLAEYKQPHQYKFFKTLPRTKNGKLQRNILLKSLNESK